MMGCDANPLVLNRVRSFQLPGVAAIEDTSSRRGGGRRAKRAGWRGRAVEQGGGVCSSLLRPERGGDDFDDGLSVIKHIVVPEAKDSVPLSLEPGSSDDIVGLLVIGLGSLRPRQEDPQRHTASGGQLHRTQP